MLTDLPFFKDVQGSQVSLAQKEKQVSQEQKVRPPKPVMSTVRWDGFVPLHRSKLRLEQKLAWHWLL